MNLLLALAVAVLFGAGAFLMLKRDLIRVVAGVITISNAAILFVMAAGLFRGHAPIYPLPGETRVSDPLVQALALTAVVISFSTTVLLLSLVYSVYVTNQALDQEDLTRQEAHYEQRLEQAPPIRQVAPAEQEEELV